VLEWYPRELDPNPSEVEAPIIHVTHGSEVDSFYVLD
jgi:hypothetical protein